MISIASDALALVRPRAGSARTGLALTAAALIALATWTGAARAQECADESTVKSTQLGSAPVELSFRNSSNERRRVYWLDANGERKFYGVVEPQHILRQPAYPGFAWLVTNDAEECLSIYTATKAPMTVDIGGPAAAQVAPPPPGQQQAITQAPSGAAAAPPPFLPTQQAAIADQAPPAPQVSPVEQFQLTGSYRLIPANEPQKALNNEASGRTEITRVKPQWDSAKWTFEEVPGTPYVRIKNEWKHTYLFDDDGKPRAVVADDDAEESQWSFEPVDGTSYVQLRNRETERYLLTLDGAPVLAEHVPEKHESRSHWNVASTAQDTVVAAVSSEYAEAVADCRGIGGYWTGSSCRAPREVVLVCPRGWRWSPKTGECQWAGRASCPPWQMRRGRCLTRADLTCRGGVVRLSGHGLSCHCPPGMAAWGNYPHLKCVPSLARIVPLLLQGKLSGGKGAGKQFGNKQFGNKGSGKKPGKSGGNKQFGNQPVGNPQFGGGKGQGPGKGQGKGQNKFTGNKKPGNVTTVAPPVVKQTTAPPPPKVKQVRPQNAKTGNGNKKTTAAPPPIVKQVRTPAGQNGAKTVTTTDPKTGQTSKFRFTGDAKISQPPPPPPVVKVLRPQNGKTGNGKKQTVTPNNAAALKAQQKAAAKAKAANNKALQQPTAKVNGVGAVKAKQKAAAKTKPAKPKPAKIKNQAAKIKAPQQAGVGAPKKKNGCPPGKQLKNGKCK